MTEYDGTHVDAREVAGSLPPGERFEWPEDERRALLVRLLLAIVDWLRFPRLP